LIPARVNKKSNGCLAACTIILPSEVPASPVLMAEQSCMNIHHALMVELFGDGAGAQIAGRAKQCDGRELELSNANIGGSIVPLRKMQTNAGSFAVLCGPT
jgi:hypothetical protein